MILDSLGSKERHATLRHCVHDTVFFSIATLNKPDNVFCNLVSRVLCKHWLRREGRFYSTFYFFTRLSIHRKLFMYHVANFRHPLSRSPTPTDQSSFVGLGGLEASALLSESANYNWHGRQKIPEFDAKNKCWVEYVVSSQCFKQNKNVSIGLILDGRCEKTFSV